MAAFLDELGATSSSEDDEDEAAAASLPSNTLQTQVGQDFQDLDVAPNLQSRDFQLG